jgi:hypothetical protein
MFFGQLSSMHLYCADGGNTVHGYCNILLFASPVKFQLFDNKGNLDLA